MRISIQTALLLLLFIAVSAEAAFHLGPVSLMRAKVEALKEKKDEELTTVWVDLDSELTGTISSGNYRFASSRSPYLINGALVFENADIEIEDGVTIKMNGGASVEVNNYSETGTFNANGTSGSGILITSAFSQTAGIWEYFQVKNAESVINYMTVEYGRIGLNLSGGCVISDSSFRYNSEIGLRVTEAPGSWTSTVRYCALLSNGIGLKVASSNNVLQIVYSSIRLNSNHGIMADAFSSFEASENNILDNSAANSSSYDFGTTAATTSYLKNNWWGITVSTSIAAEHIDQKGSGTVVYEPIKTSEVSATGPR